MLGAFVSANDYRDYSGLGDLRPDDVVNLQKALSAGQDVNDPGVGAGVGFPLRTESLEATLKNVTYEMDEIKLFKSIPKVPAANTVEEYNRLIAYSEGGATEFNQGFFQEGDLPDEQDSTYERVTVLIKYIGTVGRITHVVNTIRAAHGSVLGTETMNRTMDLLRNVEHSLFFGDSSLIPEQWDGLYKLISDGAPENVIDLRGEVLTEDALNDMLLTIRDNFGQATDAYWSTGPFADLAKQVYERQRFAYAPAPGVLGAQVSAFQGQHGKISLHDHVFIQPGRTPAASGLGKPDRRPLAPTISVAPAAAGSGSKFAAADAGVYFYRVAAGNKHGKSTPVDTASVTVAEGEQVTFTIADGGQGTTYYEVYRTEAGAAVDTAKLITRIARTGASTVFTDTNEDLPGTSKGFVLQQNQRSFSWAQLLPMTRIPLAAIDTSIRWAQVLYGAIKMYTPAKNVVVKNIGRASGSIGSGT